MYDDNMKGFLRNLSVALGGTIQEAAFETVRVAMNVPGLKSLIPDGGSAPPIRLDLGLEAPATASTVNVDAYLAEINAKQAIIESQGREIATLQAAIDAHAATTVAAVVVPEAAPAPARKRAATVTKVDAVVVNGTTTPVPSWKQAVIAAVARVYEDGRIGELPTAWFTTVERPAVTTKVDNGLWFLSNLSATAAEARLKKITGLGYAVAVQVKGTTTFIDCATGVGF